MLRTRILGQGQQLMRCYRSVTHKHSFLPLSPPKTRWLPQKRKKNWRTWMDLKEASAMLRTRISDRASG
jgi:hypothetical protein